MKHTEDASSKLEVKQVETQHEKSFASGFEISYFNDNNLSLPQFRPGSKDSKNRSAHFSGSKK